jgi:hypothetical protein
VSVVAHEVRFQWKSTWATNAQGKAAIQEVKGCGGTFGGIEAELRRHMSTALVSTLNPLSPLLEAIDQLEKYTTSFLLASTLCGNFSPVIHIYSVVHPSLISLSLVVPNSMQPTISDTTKAWALNLRWSRGDQCAVWDPKAPGLDIWECVQDR